MQKPKSKSAMAQLLDGLKNSDASYHEEISILEKTEAEERGEITSFFPEQNHMTISSEKITASFLDTADCFPWKYADRPDDEMGNLDELAESINSNEQQEPILVRPSKENSSKYEIIFGNRRWRACRQINKKVLAFIKNISDKEAAILQKEENESRENISDFAKARSFKRMLAEGLFHSENELSAELGVSRQKLNDILAFNRIPQELLDAIPGVKDISRVTAVKIATLAKSKENIPALLELAEKIGLRKITASNLENEVRKLLFTEEKDQKKEEIVLLTNVTGEKLALFKKNKKGEISIKIANTSNVDLKEIREVIKGFLKI